MRKILAILGAIVAVLGVILAFTPLDTIPLLPALIALVLGFIALKLYQNKKRSTKFPKIIIALAFLTGAIVLGKSLFFENEIAVDTEFEEKQELNKQESIQELNEIEELNNIEDLDGLEEDLDELEIEE